MLLIKEPYRDLGMEALSMFGSIDGYRILHIVRFSHLETILILIVLRNYSMQTQESGIRDNWRGLFCHGKQR